MNTTELYRTERLTQKENMYNSILASNHHCSLYTLNESTLSFKAGNFHLKYTTCNLRGHRGVALRGTWHDRLARGLVANWNVARSTQLRRSPLYVMKRLSFKPLYIASFEWIGIRMCHFCLFRFVSQSMFGFLAWSWMLCCKRVCVQRNDDWNGTARNGLLF